jgi:YidC/Oxa1 family membrane protein insertase
MSRGILTDGRQGRFFIGDSRRDQIREYSPQNVLRNAAELHHASWLWLSDLSLPDPLHILPLLIIASMSLTQAITPMSGMSIEQQRMMAVLMPTVMGFSLWRYAAGISLYWVTGNLIGLLMQSAINRSPMGREIRALALARNSNF